MRPPVSAAALSHLIGLVYDCAVDAERWPAALDAVRRTLGYHHAVLAVHEVPSGRVQMDQAVNLAPTSFERMRRYDAHAVALWGGLAYIRDHPVHEPAVLSRVNPAGLRDAANPWISDWAAPLEIVDHLALVLARDDAAVGCVGFARHGDDGPIGNDDIAAVRLLIPHLQRAAAIGRLLDEHRAVAGRLAAALEHLAAPVLLLTEDAAVLHANAAGHDLLAAGMPLALRHGRLWSPLPDVAQAVAQALGRCALGRDAATHGGFGIPARGDLASDDGASAGVFALHLLPLGQTRDRPPLVRGAVAALFVASPKALPGRADDLVAALYGLTPAEARVFAAIAHGHTPAEAAAVLGVAPSTLRTHLLRVFDKLGVHRQSDLVRLAAALTSPFVPAGHAAPIADPSLRRQSPIAS